MLETVPVGMLCNKSNPHTLGNDFHLTESIHVKAIPLKK